MAGLHGQQERDPVVVLISTGIRPEEKMLIEAFRRRGVALHAVDDREVHGPLSAWPQNVPHAEVVLARSKSHWRNVTLARWMEAHGARVVNPSRVLETCGDKAATTLALIGEGVPSLSASVAFSRDAGLEAGRQLGYPVVVKPVVGSWGRLIGKANDCDALELALEHKEAVGGSPHAATYLQPFVETGGMDIRAFVIGGRCVAAIERHSSHWRTNTALGARAVGRLVDEDLAAVAEAAAAAVSGALVAVDLFETPHGLLVNEVNGTMEFRNSVDTTGVDIPGIVADHVLEMASVDRGLGLPRVS